MLKKWAALLLCVIGMVSFPACGKEQGTKPEDGKVRVTVSFNAMKEFAAAVGQEKVEISTIIPDGMEPHAFEPKAQDLVGLGTADIFVYNGLGMETWAQDAVKAANNPDIIVVEASEGADLIANIQSGKEEHGEYDPHIWLSLKGAETEARNIRDALVKADPSNQVYYEENCDDFILQLENLYEEYREQFQSVEKKSFVTGHAAFAYLCRDFDLEQNSVEDVFAEGEPSAQQLAALVDYCRENDVTTIFAEEMASPDISRTLADEVGAKVETIYTIGSSEDDMTYFDRMEENLLKIYRSLAG